MATSTVNTNKPIIPRGADVRPIDSYNRAALYSGKALDFDGVNDQITIPNSDSINITGNALTIAGYINTDGSAAWQGICYKDSGNLNGFQLFVDKTGDPNIAFGIHTGGFYRLFSNEVIENEKWYFVVATYDGVNQSIYINGAFDNSQAVTGNITDSSAENLYIGRNTGGSERFNGQIAGFKIFNTALTAAQIADLYNNPEKVVPTGVDNTALKLWLPMQEGAGTTAINGAPDALGDELFTQPIDLTAEFSTNGGGIIVDANTFTTAGGSFDGIRANNILTTGKVYVLQIEGSTTSSGFAIGDVQSSGNEYGANFGVYYFKAVGHTLWIRQTTAGTTDLTTLTLKELKDVGTISGATWTHGIGAPVAQTAVIDWNKHSFDVSTDILIPQGLNAGRDIGGNLFENVRKQGALNLDGNSWAEVHDNASLDFGTGSFTLEAWVRAKYVSQGSSLNAIMTLGDSSNSTTSASINIISSGGSKPQIYYRGAGTTATNNQTDGDWFHIVGIYDGTNMNIYINGALDNSSARVASSITNDFVKMIGRDTTTVRFYNDQIAQPRIYNRALTAEEVLKNYNATSSLYI